MYTLSEPVRTGRPAHELDSRELPVLFHLIDVSMPRARPSEPAVPVEPVAEASAAELLFANLPATNTPAAVPQPPIPAADEASNGETLQVVVAAAVEASADQPLHAAAKNETATHEAATSVVPETSQTPPVTPSSATSGRRKAKTSASEEWFASHGKFIALAFVLALIGTIYFARTNRQQPDQSAAAASPTIELAQTPVAFAAPATQVATNKVVEHAAGTSQSKVDLLPPTPTKSSADTAASSTAPAGDNLFVFPSKANDERMAARPEPVAAQAVEHAGSQGSSPPTLTPSYPTTSTAPPAYPTASTTTPVYPTATAPVSSYPVTASPVITNPNVPAGPAPANTSTWNAPPPRPAASSVPPGYGSQYQPPAQPSQQQSSQWSPPAGSAAYAAPPTSGGYQPFDNTASGTRYERTGSGNY